MRIEKEWYKGRETTTEELIIRLPKEAKNKNFENLHEVSMLYAHFLCLEEAQENNNARLIKENQLVINSILEGK